MIFCTFVNDVKLYQYIHMKIMLGKFITFLKMCCIGKKTWLEKDYFKKSTAVLIPAVKIVTKQQIKIEICCYYFSTLMTHLLHNKLQLI